MGRVKDGMIRDQENLSMAVRYLVEKKYLKHCEHHGEIFGGGGWDLEQEFWRNAMADRNRGDHGPVPWAAGMEAREFTDLLKAAYEGNCGDDCGYCEKNEAE